MKKLLEANTGHGRRRIDQVFRDFCELAAISIRNSVDLRDRDTREARYMRLIGEYTPEEADRFSQVLAKLVLEFEAGSSDVLGKLYMSLDLGSDRLGQFFTPYEVSELIAKMTIGDYTSKLVDQEFITVNEPTCGSGGMIVALADALRSAGVNPQKAMHVTAQDIESTSVFMTYIQLALLHIPAIVIHGDTLKLEQREVWYSPAHILGGWDAKLRTRAVLRAALKLVPADKTPTLAQPAAEPGEAPVTYIGQQEFDIEGIA